MMKQLLIIGSTVVDIIIHIDHLPVTAEDINVQRQTTALGGCAYNVSETVRQFGVPYTLFSPIGTGIYGDYIRSEFEKRGRRSPLPTPEMDNGCCYCFVERSGERTFVSNHGAEYLIYEKWLNEIDTDALSGIYVCGFEIEDGTGEDIIRFLARAGDVPIYFAPGPRICLIQPDRLERLWALHPVVHLNADELCQYTRQRDLAAAAQALAARTRNTLLITEGSRGASFFKDGQLTRVGPFPAAHIADTIGAGDSHAGACIACLAKGMPLADAVRTANRVASAVVSSEGAVLPDEVFAALF